MTGQTTLRSCAFVTRLLIMLSAVSDLISMPTRFAFSSRRSAVTTTISIPVEADGKGSARPSPTAVHADNTANKIGAPDVLNLISCPHVLLCVSALHYAL